MTKSSLTLKFDPTRTLIVLTAIIIVMVVLSVWGQSIKYAEANNINGAWSEYAADLLIRTFYVDAEGNIPTYYNTFLLFAPAILLGIISAWKYSIKDKFRIHWIGLALVFLFLSMDEASVLHERLIKPMRTMVKFEGYSGLFYFAWVIPGMIAVAVFLLAYLQFFLNLDNKFKILFFISLGLYIGGVLGGEMLSGHFAKTIGLKSFNYALYTSLEEALELFGAAMVSYSLLAYIKSYLPNGITLAAD